MCVVELPRKRRTLQAGVIMKRADIQRASKDDLRGKLETLHWHDVLIDDYLVYITLKNLFGDADLLSIDNEQVDEWFFVLKVPSAYISITAWQKMRQYGGMAIYLDQG